MSNGVVVVRVVIEHPCFIPYHPHVVRGGVEQTSNTTAIALRSAGHHVSYLVPHGSVETEYTITCPPNRSTWYATLNELAATHDVVIMQDRPVVSLLAKYPSLTRKALIIDHHVAPIVTRQLIDDVVTLGATYVTTDVVCEGHTGRLINQCVPRDLAPLTEPAGNLLVACSRNAPVKKLDVAIEAMEELGRQGYQTVLCTDQHLPSTTVDVRVGVRHSELMILLAQATCLIHPSVLEKNGSCIAFEAAAHGTPVIHCIDNADYFLKPSGCSRKIASPTAKNIIEAVLQMQPTDRTAARQWIGDHFSEAAYVKRLEQWFDHVVGTTTHC